METPLYILILSLCMLSSFFNHLADDGLLFISEDVLGMVFSAAWNMVLTRQVCASMIITFLEFVFFAPFSFLELSFGWQVLGLYALY